MKQRSDGLALVAIYHFISGILSLLVMCGIFSIPFIVAVSSAGDRSSGGAAATAIVGVIGLVAGALFFLIAIANFVVGWGLWQRREWARLGAMGLAILRLLNIPLGTVVGGLILWYLLQDDVKAEFTSAR